MDRGGSGIEGGIGVGCGGSLASGIPLAAIFGATGGALLRLSRLSGGRRSAGLDEFRRLANGSVSGWLFDFRRPVGGVESVRSGTLARPGCIARGFVPSERKASVCSRRFGWADWRKLVSAKPADKGHSEGGSPVMEASGREPAAAVSSCILEADNRRTPSFALVFVDDRLRAFPGTSLEDPLRDSRSLVELVHGDSLLWVFVCVSGPLGIDCESTGEEGFGVCSVGVGDGDGRWGTGRCSWPSLAPSSSISRFGVAGTRLDGKIRPLL